MTRFSSMFSGIFKAAAPANTPDTLEELRERVNRLFIIITRSRVLIDRFERRVAILEDGAPACSLYMLEISNILVDRLELRLGAVMDRVHSKNRSYQAARELSDMPLDLSDIELLQTAGLSDENARSVSIEECAGCLERLFNSIHVSIERSLPEGFYLRALA